MGDTYIKPLFALLLAPDTDDPIPVEVMRMVSAQLIEEPELIVCSQNTEIKHKRER